MKYPTKVFVDLRNGSGGEAVDIGSQLEDLRQDAIPPSAKVDF